MITVGDALDSPEMAGVVRAFTNEVVKFGINRTQMFAILMIIHPEPISSDEEKLMSPGGGIRRWRAGFAEAFTRRLKQSLGGENAPMTELSAENLRARQNTFRIGVREIGIYDVTDIYFGFKDIIAEIIKAHYNATIVSSTAMETVGDFVNSPSAVDALNELTHVWTMPGSGSELDWIMNPMDHEARRSALFESYKSGAEVYKKFVYDYLSGLIERQFGAGTRLATITDEAIDAWATPLLTRLRWAAGDFEPLVEQLRQAVRAARQGVPQTEDVMAVTTDDPATARFESWDVDPHSAFESWRANPVSDADGGVVVGNRL